MFEPYGEKLSRKVLRRGAGREARGLSDHNKVHKILLLRKEKNMTGAKKALISRFTIISVLAIFVTINFFCGNGNSNNSQKIPQYSIVKTEDVSSRDAKRLRVRASVDTLLDETQVRAICNEIIEKNSYKKNGYKAVQFLFYLPDTDINGQFTSALAEWAPNGIWADAAKMDNGDYSAYKLKIEIAKKVEWTDKTGLTSEKKREIFYQLVVVEDSLFNVGAEGVSKKSHNIIAKRYNVSLENVDEIVKEGLLKSWPIP